jgi:SAM-dependent methyltransferase
MEAKVLEPLPPVLDACCGSRMMWFDCENPAAIFVDNRKESHILCDGRSLEISPNIIADFTSLPFPNETFYLVVFDPPHLASLGENSWLAKKYGRLIGEWRDEIREGFSECFRVLKPNGTLIFKWNATEIPLSEILKLAPQQPLFGHISGRQSKTHWICFLKHECDKSHN